jgi:hypothetical protein
MLRASVVHPPRIAAWLIDLFTPYEQAESIPGDLLEEFSELAMKAGVPSASRWYWRQSVKTIVQLIGSAFRVAPQRLLAAVLVGFLLLRLGIRLPGAVVIAVLRAQRPYSTAHYESYVLWITYGFDVVRLMLSISVGCIVAVVAKGREIVAAMTLGLVSGALYAASSVVWITSHGLDQNRFLLPLLFINLSGLIASVCGALIVRTSRSAILRHRSRA